KPTWLAPASSAAASVSGVFSPQILMSRAMAAGFARNAGGVEKKRMLQDGPAALVSFATGRRAATASEDDGDLKAKLEQARKVIAHLMGHAACSGGERQRAL